jgi:ABC-2 type transport system permease protein
VIGAFLYLLAMRFKNILLTRLRRLKQPRYLIFALIGGAYIYFFFIRFYLRPLAAPHPAAAMNDSAREGLELGAAFFLTFLAFVRWVYPSNRAKLFFTEAEIAFLFPAPLSRRALFHYQLLKSQTGILFTSLVISLIATRFLGTSALILYPGVWIVFTTMSLHSRAISFAKAGMVEHGFSGFLRNFVFLLIPIAAVVVCGAWLYFHFDQALESGPLLYLLYPARLVVAPLFAKSAAGLAAALGPALLILVLHYAWLFRMNVSFEEASIAYSAKIASRLEARKKGLSLPGPRKDGKTPRAPFRLEPTGSPEGALLWKNLISTGRMFSARTLVLTVLPLCVLAVVLLANNESLNEGFGATAGLLCLIIAGMMTLMGPAMFRSDLRKDLAHLEELKALPVPGYRIVRGEILAPLAVSVIASWILIVLGILLLAAFELSPKWGLAHFLPLGVSGIILIPGLHFLFFVLFNAIVVVLPGWSTATQASAGIGIEKLGQRLILSLGIILSFAVAIIPSSLLCLPIVLFGYPVLGWWIAPLAALAALAVLAAEGWFACHLLGIAFDRIDPAQELAGTITS